MLQLRFQPRDPQEANRTATALELMFDLATVVAVSAAAYGLAQAVAAGHALQGTIRFLCAFFMAWLAWLNYTWFASAYDNNSAMFRTLSLVIMFGSLALAGGIQSVFNDQPIWLALVGFIVMRLGMIALWLGAANGDRQGRPAALRYAGGIAVMQTYWIIVISSVSPQATLYFPLFALGAAGELAIPILAEHRSTTSWHRRHIIDRYNSFNIIVLGECFAVIAAILAAPVTPDLRYLWLAALCSLIAFSMWGLYFDRKKQLTHANLKWVLIWAYGHCALFAAGAATAAGFAVLLTVTGNRATISQHGVALAISIPVALYLTSLWLVRDSASLRDWKRWLPLLAAALVLASSAFMQRGLESIAAVLGLAALMHRRLR